jgi:DNA-binding NarL/FixJ family response regulator
MQSEPPAFVPFTRRVPIHPRLVDLRIALIDDEHGLRTHRPALDRAGALVATAGSYDEAMRSEIIRACDVLIANLELPGASLHDLIRLVGGLERPRACIALTRRGDGAGLDDAWRAGFRMCVRTPCDPDVLASAAAVLRGC